MIEPPAALPATPWQAAIRPGRRIGCAIEVHAAIGSTNDRARELLEAGEGDGRVVLAEEQVSGRGRRGRTWVSPPRLNLMLSVALRPRLAAAEAWQLPLAAALAAADACETVAPVVLKWPNDVVAGDGRKIGGLLIETTAEAEDLTAAVIGLGINVNWRRAEMPEALREGSTSLAELAGAPVDRVALLAMLLDRLDAEVAAIEHGRSPLERYAGRCATIGETVTVSTPDGTLRGRAVALDPTGALVVETAAGRRAVPSGEVMRLRPEEPG